MSDKEKILKAVKTAYCALDDKKAIDIKILDIQEISIIADYFIIAGGQSTNQLQAMADFVQESLHKEGFNLTHSEGYQSGTWILLDFSSIIIHLFNKDERIFYNLERIWGDAKEIKI